MSEHTNPALYKEMDDEGKAAFKEVTSNETLTQEEFGKFMDKMDEHGKKRFG